MRQKIALIVPYKNLQRNPQNICSPHIGIAYVASALESEGYRVDVIDALTNNYSHNQLIKRVVESNPDAVGITSTTDVRFQAMKIIQDLKRRLNVFIFAGGPHFTLTAQDALENIPGLDAVVIGEGEDTSRVLLNAYFGKGSFNEIKGVGYRDGGIKINPLRDPIKDLDSLLRPAWHLFSMRNYRKTLVRADGNTM
ncbi:MAG: cobalamin B12-binding domain-containing protein, partial [Candidatus Omnitrophica bacterium]|nr:cobalamin B12-binding domain-containing protein [Candidatus Omnitrophota bacterium]